MKVLSVKIDDELHKQLKLLAIHQEKTMAEIVMNLVKKRIRNKKRTNTVTLASVCLFRIRNPLTNRNSIFIIKNSDQNYKENFNNETN